MNKTPKSRGNALLWILMIPGVCVKFPGMSSRLTIK